MLVERRFSVAVWLGYVLLRRLHITLCATSRTPFLGISSIEHCRGCGRRLRGNLCGALALLGCFHVFVHPATETPGANEQEDDAQNAHEDEQENEMPRE